MSRTRQRAEPQVRTASVAYTERYTWRERRSGWAQLLYAARGSLTVHTDAGLWVVPPDQAVWVPPGVRHDVEVAGRASMRMIYLKDSLGRRLPDSCRVVQLSPLLRELLRRAMQLRTLDRRKREQRHLIEVMLDELAMLPRPAIDLPNPRDPRGVRAAALVRGTSDGRHRLADVARESGASPRTLERLFRLETGMSFGAWRQRARLLRSLQLLAEGTSVTNAALAVGYESTSAFVAAFRRAFGKTPGRYFKAAEGEREIETGVGAMR
jgi:AraC-like DNA-binding protein